MGKVAAAAETKRKKKKGRPSLLDLQKRALEQQQQQQQEQSLGSNFNTSKRRSSRRNPNAYGIYGSPEFIDDDDDERKEKKVKLVVRLPQSTQHFPDLPRSSSVNSVSGGSDSYADGDNLEASVKKRKVNVGSGDDFTDQGEKLSIATDTLHGSPLESGPTRPLPDKKLLVFILERLQKKDTYGVFSEPVDSNELPDYHEIIEHPMDFGTVRRKLDEGIYSNLEELEADVFLICSNAMHYNSSDTIYFRQARSIQELAKRDFENLRQEGVDGELQPKVVKRGRPPSKHLKKSLGSSPVHRVGPELTSGATLATGEDKIDSNPYSLRRGPMMHRFHSADGFLTSQRSRNGENYSELSSDWNNEFPASILKADLKYGKKQFSIDETRRDTYKQFHPSAFVHEPSLPNLGENMKQLMAVGLHTEHGYARSLARFAANLGPVVWKIASKKIERVLPSGVKFGPGMVGENEASPQTWLQRSACDGHLSIPETPSTSGAKSVSVYGSSSQGKHDMVEVDRKIISQSELSFPSRDVSGLRPSLSFQTPHNQPLSHHGRNGYNGVFGYNLPSQMGMVGLATPTGKSGPEMASVPSQMLGKVCGSDAAASTSSAPTRRVDAEHKLTEISRTGIDSAGAVPEEGHYGKPSWQVLSTNHRQYSLPVPPDLNVGLQGPGSPNSGLRIGSPQHPDLALQL